MWFTILLCACLFFSHDLQAKEDGGVAQVTDKPASGQAKIGGFFSLKDHQGVQRRDTDFRGKYMLVYFGYTFCPDICPTALIAMTEALNQLGSKSKEVTPLFITVDPERDTQEQLALYHQNYHPQLVMLTGSKQAVEQAKKSYRVYAAKAKPDVTTSDYLMDHSSIIYLMDRQGRFVAHFNHATSPDEIANRLKSLL